VGSGRRDRLPATLPLRLTEFTSLIKHTGGIRDWTGLLPLAPEGTDVATLLLRQRGLNFVPGTEWAYSNGGYELAKMIVARVSGMSFAGQPTNNPKRPLVHITGATFGVGSADAGTTLTFIFDPDGRATTMVMKQNGRERTLTRLK
jgi:hypothetical protein